jgi:ATP-dependent DNA helicase RecG
VPIETRAIAGKSVRSVGAGTLIACLAEKVGDIARACRAAGTAEPRWELESGGLRLEFVLVGTANRSFSGGAARESGGAARQARGTGPSQPESRPESQPESLVARVLRQLAAGPMSKSGLSRSLGQRSVSGQLNKVVSALLADGSIGYTIPDRPRSRLQEYRLTDAGRAAAEGLSDGGGREKSTGSGARA